MPKRKDNKLIYWQDWGTFYGTTMVLCGWKDYAEALEYLKKKSVNNKAYREWYNALKVKEGETSDCNHFSRWTVEELKNGRVIDTIHYSLLWLKDWKEDLRHYKILAHELVHAISFCMKDFLNPMKENEAFAYQHSYLFEKIATKLNELYGKGSC